MRQNIHILSLLFCLFNLTTADSIDIETTSIMETIRSGVTVISRFLYPKPLFRKIVEDIKVHQRNNKDFAWLLLELMGVQRGSITNYALDGVIFIILLINKTLLLKNETQNRKKRKTRMDFSLFGYILNRPQVGNLLISMQDPNLIDVLLTETRENLKTYKNKDIDCIQLLICRTKPFVKGMQRSLKFFMNLEGILTCEKRKPEENICQEKEKEEINEWEKEDLEGRMFFFLPNLEETVQVGDECERLYPNCVY